MTSRIQAIRDHLAAGPLPQTTGDGLTSINIAEPPLVTIKQHTRVVLTAQNNKKEKQIGVSDADFFLESFHLKDGVANPPVVRGFRSRPGTRRTAGSPASGTARMSAPSRLCPVGFPGGRNAAKVSPGLRPLGRLPRHREDRSFGGEQWGEAPQ